MSLKFAKLLLFFYIFSLGYIQPSIRIADFVIPPSDFIFIATCFFWSLALLRGETSFKSDKGFIFLYLYFSSLAISVFFSEMPQKSFLKLFGEAYLVTLPIIFSNLIESEGDFKKAIFSWLAGASVTLLIALISIISFYAQENLLPFTTYHYGSVLVGHYPRIRSTFLTPSLFLNYLSVTAGILIVARRILWIDKKSFLLGLIFIFLVSAFTFSSGIAGLAITYGGWVYLDENKPRFLRVSVLSFSVLLALVLYAVNFFALQPHSTAPFSLKFLGINFFPSARLLVWNESLQTFFTNFWFGRGVGTESCRVLFENTDGTFSLLTDAHNTFLSIASQAGIFGLLTILILSFVILRRAFSKNLCTETQKLLLRCFGVCFISAFLYQGLLSSFENARHLWSLVGLIFAVSRCTSGRTIKI